MIYQLQQNTAWYLIRNRGTSLKEIFNFSETQRLSITSKMDSESCSSILWKMKNRSLPILFSFKSLISAWMLFPVKYPHLPSHLEDQFNTEEVTWHRDLNTNSTRNLWWHLCIQVRYTCVCLKFWEGKRKGSISFTQKNWLFLWTAFSWKC